MTARLMTRVTADMRHTYAMEVRDDTGTLVAESPESPDARECRQWLIETFPDLREQR